MGRIPTQGSLNRAQDQQWSLEPEAWQRVSLAASLVQVLDNYLSLFVARDVVLMDLDTLSVSVALSVLPYTRVWRD